MSVKSFDIAPGLAYGDASFFVALLEENEQFHDECMDFSIKLEAAKSVVVLSALGLGEIWYALLRIHGAADYGQKEWFRKLKDDKSALVSYVPFLEQAVSVMKTLPYLLFIDVTIEQTLAGIESIRTDGLFPRDAIHVSIARSSSISNIITTNRDYAKLTDFNVYTCNPAAF